MNNIGVWIFLIIIVANVINSVRKSAAKNEDPAIAAQRMAQLQARREAYMQQVAAQQAAARSQYVLPPVDPPSPPVPVRVAPAAAPQQYTAPQYVAPAQYAAPVASAAPAPPPAPTLGAIARGRRVVAAVQPVSAVATGVLDGMFEDPRSIVRAMVAHEVLGLPKALAERQTFWSQPPSVR